MPFAADKFPAPPGFSLLGDSGIEQNQQVAPDLFFFSMRDGRGRFARGHSGNPRGRPRGIANPQRRIPDLRSLKLSGDALAALLRRKPYLLRPFLAQLLAIDAAARLGAELSRGQSGKIVRAAQKPRSPPPALK
jgi:hypothetical protein